MIVRKTRTWPRADVVGSLEVMLLPVLLIVLLCSISPYTATVLFLAVGAARLYSTVRRKYGGKINPVGKAVLITGCDTGISQALAKLADSRGFTVFSGCLDIRSEGAQTLLESSSRRLRILKLDVTKESDVRAAVDLVRTEFGYTGLWAVINNAGLHFSSPIELTSLDVFKQLAEVNLFGAIRVTRACLPLLRLARGRVVVVSSNQGIAARTDASAYCVTKFVLEAFSDVLRQEMSQFGVKVTVVEPGTFGAATCINDATRTKHRMTLSQMEVGDDVKFLYPEFTVGQDFKAKRSTYLRSSNPSLEPVLRVVEEQLLNRHIQTRYLISGSHDNRTDWLTMTARYKHILPDWLVDTILLKLFSRSS